MTMARLIGPAWTRSTDWYIANGSTGLFAVCLSSEMYDLSDYERLALARRVVGRAGGRAAVVATGTFGGSLEAQAASIRAMAETGVDAVVVIPSQIATPDEDEAILEARLLQLAASDGSDPAGPVRMSCTVSPADFAGVAGPVGADGALHLPQGHLLRWRPDPRRSWRAVAGTPLGFFNANTASALDSLAWGAAGLSPIGANYYPQLYVRLMHIWQTDPVAARDLQRMLAVMERAASTQYPAAAKRCLAKLGLPIGPRCRVPMPIFNYEDDAILAALMETAQRL